MKKLKTILESNWSHSNPTATDHLNNKLKKHYNSYDEYHEGAIKDYTEDSSKLNSYHWDKSKELRDEERPMENRSQDMDGAINQHKTPHKLTVYAGVKYNPVHNMNEKNEVNHPAYLSTSLDKDSAKYFGMNTTNTEGKTRRVETHVLKINVPKNHPGAYVEHHTSNYGEREFILPRNTKLKYKGSQTYKKEDTGHDTDVVEHSMDVI